MSAHAPATRVELRNPHVSALAPAELIRSRAARQRVQLVWFLLFLNVLSYGDTQALIQIPGALAKAVLQGALLCALVVALSVNPRGLVRPNTYLLVLTLLAGDALAMGLRSEFYLGSTYRAVRLTIFVVVLWLISPWWQSRRLLLWCHLRALAVLLATVAVGAVIAPGKAFSFEGRLSGVLWPIPATQVAHYAAVAVGLVIVLWLSGRPTTRRGLAAAGVGATLLILTHTRTALVAMLAGILVGGLSLFLGRARVRKAFLTTGIVVAVGAAAYAPVVDVWLRRGQDQHSVTNLTGRTEVWTMVLAAPRTAFHRLFGDGLSNKSFNGLPIDSSWLSTYQDLGLLGLSLIVLLLLGLIVGALSVPRSPERALALFLVTYSIIASITETGLGDATPYVLDLTVAASLLAQARRGTEQPQSW